MARRPARAMKVACGFTGGGGTHGGSHVVAAEAPTPDSPTSAGVWCVLQGVVSRGMSIRAFYHNTRNKSNARGGASGALC